MDVPDGAKSRFDVLVNRPLQSTRSEIKRFAPFATAVREAPPSPRATAVVQGVEALLGRVERSTSPLYVRLIHATARFVSEDEAVDWRLAGQVLDAVAYTTRHFDLMLQERE